MALRALGVRDLGRVDFRIGEDGRIYLLEVNALPSLERGASLFAAAVREGLDYEAALGGHRRQRRPPPGADGPGRGAPAPRRPTPLRIGFTYNVKRVASKGGNDAEAEYDAPETIDSIRDALESYGHVVIPLEATAELPRQLMESPVDLVFNIAEGVSGRNREAVVPALCELMGIPYTGSDAATLSIALDKALSKRVLREHGILTPEFQVMETGRERLSPKLKFPLIVKPNQEGSSQGRQRPGLGVRQRGGAARGGARPARALPAAGAGRGLHRRPRVHGRPAGRQAPAGAAAHGDRLPRQGQPAAGLRLPDQAGVGETRLLRVPGQADPGRAEGHRAGLRARPSTRSTAATWPASTCA